ncbi:MAG: AarF/UbiB family protein [Desulfatiglans sp.]|jgi:ubiquinone biosynthesis protein|nr:AarF/UbiB family protein [Thermodesulfobacteriota bacterium]MEE4352508.1 AarF/UbiB family protein [Desulfatiglans sp.]
MDIKTLAGLGRFKDIIMILIKYGFHDLVDRLDIPGIGLVKKVHKVDHEMGTFERIRRALEELGPTFVKFGQIMSLRPDLLPHGLIDELSKLQDEVAPVEFSQIKEAIEKETKLPLKETFSIFDAEPLAAASVSQVHRGVLKSDGRIASIKVQRPGIRSKIEKDLDILASIADQLHERIADLKTYDLPNLVRVTRRNLLRELDFKREARNMKIAISYSGEDSEIYIPEVYEEFSTERFLVMEFVQGTKLKDLKKEDLTDPETLARQGLKAAMKQILDDGFFHADPHPGNLLITDKERICLLDWGMTGRLSERDRHELIDLIKSIVDKDGEAIVHALLRLGNAHETINQRGLEREILDVLDAYYAVPIKEMNIGHLLVAITELVRTYRLSLPPDLVIVIKALVTAEGTARLIYPDLDVISEAEGYISSLALKRFKPESLWRSFRFTLSQFLSLQKEVPSRMVQVLNKAGRGELTLGFRHENLDGLRNTLDNITNRLTFSIIIAAMIIGSSMIITTGLGPLLFGFPALGVIGYLISGLLGLWLIFNIIRGRKY